MGPAKWRCNIPSGTTQHPHMRSNRIKAKVEVVHRVHFVCLNKSRARVIVVHRVHVREMMRGSKDFKSNFYGKSMWCCWFLLFVVMLFDFVIGERECRCNWELRSETMLESLIMGKNCWVTFRTLFCFCLLPKSMYWF